MLLNKVFISSLVPRPFIRTYFYGHEVNVEIYVDVVNKCVIFYITANDFNKHLEKFRVLAIFYRLHAVLRKGLVMYLYTNKHFRHCHKSDFSASWSICQHGCLTEVNTTFHSISRNERSKGKLINSRFANHRITSHRHVWGTLIPSTPDFSQHLPKGIVSTLHLP